MLNFSVNGLPTIDNLIFLFSLKLGNFFRIPLFQFSNGTLNRERNLSFLQHYTDKLSVDIDIASMTSKIQAPENFNSTQIANKARDFGINSLRDDEQIASLPMSHHG